MSASDAPWIAALRAFAEKHGQKAAGDKIGYSNGLVSSVLKGTYKGDLSRVRAAVEGALMGHTVDCPVIGEIPRQACVTHQRRANDPKATNPSRVALAKECPRCPHASDSKASTTQES